MQTRPYRGAEYYRTQDRHLFFGRSTDAAGVVAMVLSYPLSVLHAVSGVGKTSLANALVMPELEDRGWIVVPSIPQTDPARALKAATLQRVLPDPALEVAAIDCALEVIGRRRGLENDPSLSRLRRWVADEGALSRATDDYVRLVSPVARSPATRSAEGPAEDENSALVTPFFTRFLQLDTGHLLLARQLLAWERLAGTGAWRARDADGLVAELKETPLSSLRRCFETLAAGQWRRPLLRYLTEPGLPLRTFFTRLHDLWGRGFEQFSLVLVLDQFEELFTRFVDQGHRGAAVDHNLPDWTLRPAYFEALGELFQAKRGEGPPGQPPPLRILISVRDDYIADLDQLQRHTETIPGQARYHLQPLQRADVSDVVQCPATIFNVSFAPDIVEEIGGLASEGGVEPGHVQIVCDWLWERAGKALHLQGGGTIDRDAMRDQRDAPQTVRDILNGHFQRVLEACESDEDRVEMLDLLESLITRHGTRNIVEAKALVEAPLRNHRRRAKLLELLRQRHIVRIEPRLGGNFAEITHEILIKPILDAESEEFADTATRNLWRAFVRTLDRLLELKNQAHDTATLVLSNDELLALDRWDYLVDFDAEPWIAELMYRAAIVGGMEADFVARQRRRLDRHTPQISADAIHLDLESRRRDRLLLDALELTTIYADPRWQKLDADTRLFLFESAVANAGPAERAMVIGLVRSLLP